ncbi:ABC transporter ATP-binding protein [Pseudalkalibacillus berkeleyi]|uniref:ABC transporter ATP-binding protein/permease n=1 Tax=Pseudalkalibacillus berkeleyi TaxID=1069813 RepID=A0ABS9GZ29_9BACL|nr:ABC transporter ATP-binding protein [Pseudalkalibacillus berkeleyi]MCF6136645.1 ABC transporter ATP-binding protein/permease [Pseudalkalibacillus berkeleyi]
MVNLKWLFSYIKIVKWLFALSLGLLFLETTAFIAQTGLQKYIIDDVFIAGRFDRLIPILFLFAGAFIAYAVLFTIAPHTFHRIQAIVKKQLISDFMGYMRKIPTQTYRNERVTKYVHYLTNDVDQVADTIGGFIPRSIQLCFNIVFLSVIVFISSPLLLVAIFVFSVIYVAIGKYFSPKIRKAAKDAQNRKTDLLIHIEEGIASTREIMAYNRLAWETNIYNRYFKRYFDSVMIETKMSNRQLITSQPLKWGASLIVLVYGGYSVIQGSLSIGLFIVVFQFTSQLMDSIQRLFEFTMLLSGKYSLIDRLRSVMEGPVEHEGHHTLSEKVETISFEKVSFAYQDEANKNVLNDLSLTIPAGKKVAFVGTSGGGKSTIAQLIVRFFTPTQGDILVNGKSLRDLNQSDWRNRIGIVPQDPYLFPDTVRNNILMGREGISDDVMYHACQLAEIHDYIESLPEGYETEVGERGITLSGGQRQRLALARAIIGNPEILVLDEATSSLDLETERKVQTNFDQVRTGKTTIIIAHRLSTVQNADIIFVMDKGRVVEQGAHDELLKGNTIYKSLVFAEKSTITSA